MTQTGKIVTLLLLAMILAGAGCESEPGLDKGKFSGLNATMGELKAYLEAGKSCDTPDTLLQQLSAGTAAVRDTTTSKAENDLVRAYTQFTTTYRDGLLLCRSRTRLAPFQFVPKDRIYVFQDLDPLVQKYGLSTERHLYKPTGAIWKSISEDSIRVIWEKAASQIRSIETMVKYN